MAVYKQVYKKYDGPLTEERWRFAVLSRFSFQTIIESRLLAGFYGLCFVPPILAAGLIYLNHSAKGFSELSATYGTTGVVGLVEINNLFFFTIFRIQTFLAFLLVTFIGPSLVASDVSNNALPIYFSKPFSRKEYIGSRIGVLLSLTSLITWIPGLFLVALQADMAGFPWLLANYRVPLAFFLVSWIWIVSISLFSLALSSWLKWKPLATGAMLGVFFAGAGMGEFANTVLPFSAKVGLLVNLSSMIAMVFEWIVEGFSDRGNVPAWAALTIILLLSVVSVSIIYRKIRACEVVR